MNKKLDAIDIAILRILQLNATVPYKYIAEILNKSEATISARIKRLNDLKVIRSITAQLDPSWLGIDTIGSIHLEVESESDEAMQQLRTVLNGIQGICSCTRISINVPIGLKVDVAVDHLKSFDGIKDTLASIPNVMVTRQYLELEKIILDKGFYF
jgi:Lrp/AsnC family leucine-responsive transcriptional regulator